MLVKKVPSLYRRRRALVFISSLFGRMVTERIAQVCSTRHKGQAGVLHSTYRLRLLPNRRFGAKPVTTPPPLQERATIVS
jgi:hypothetical protein